MNILRIIYVAILTPLILLACGGGASQGGTEFGNPSRVTVRVIGYQSSNFQALQLTVGDLTVNKALIVLDRLRFRPLEACIDESNESDDIRFDGPFIVDLLVPPTMAELDGVDIPSDTYCRIELRLEKLDEEDAPSSELADRSVLIEGTRADGVAFQVVLDVNEEFELRSASAGFLIDTSMDIDTFFIAFDLDQWFSNVDLDDTSVDVTTDSNGDPLILIDDDNNEVLHESIIDNLKRSADLFEDKDDDDELDEDEEDDPLAEG